MASNAVNIHVPGFTFPGMMDKSMRFWQFPTISITKKDSTKQIHTRFYVGLVQSEVAKDLVAKYMNKTKASKPNPNYNPQFSFANFALKLNNSYFNHVHIPNAIAFYVTSTQLDGKDLLFRDITFVRSGKNLGKKNATNVFTQAMTDTLSKYNKKNSESLNKTTNVVLPMLAEGEGISGDDNAIKARIEKSLSVSRISGLFCQPKYDGIRTLMTLNPKYYPKNQVSLPFETDERVVCYSRKGKLLQISEHLLTELEYIMSKIMDESDMSKFVLDGEYYSHKLSFQVINGFARGETDSPEKETISIYVYDYCDGGATTYENRYNTLFANESLFNYENSPMSLLDDEDDADKGHVRLSETKRFFKVDEILEYYKTTIADGYEGIMLRMPTGVYVSARTNDLIKIKPLMSYEYVCVGYKFGKGKDADIPTIECEVGDKGVSFAIEWWQAKKGFADIVRNNYSNGKFYAKLKGLTEEEQKQLGREFVTIESNGKTRFENHYLGKKAIIEFLDISNDMKPQKANCKGWLSG